MPSLKPLLEVYSRVFPSVDEWTAPFRRLAAVKDIRDGSAVKDAAKTWRVSGAGLKGFLEGDPVETLFGVIFEDALNHPKPLKLAKRGLGQMLLGSVAEQAFERLYKRELGTDDLALEDSRQERDDTDYRVLNGNKKPV